MIDTIELETAKEIIEAAEGKANEIGVPSVITVANSEGNLIAQHRPHNPNHVRINGQLFQNLFDGVDRLRISDNQFNFILFRKG
ncbi:MAG: heme-binding protein [Euryarchaeota archaeon]|nr:heme-binding protein [Euryarchaeota archaeon]